MDTTIFQCKTCGKSFASQEELDKHRAESVVKCQTCGLEFEDRQKLEDHAATSHGTGVVKDHGKGFFSKLLSKFKKK
ncbi:C2H2-type zinc finger protein [Candidatus Parvarchaeota archaeon]|nr:C2H2-type zinc finger protein [Candidatus Parvarchaeota archaeon]